MPKQRTNSGLQQGINKSMDIINSGDDNLNSALDLKLNQVENIYYDTRSNQRRNK